jgi:uncharacterized protein (TIGR00255 family)
VLRSMTGFGSGRVERDGVAVEVEVRSVNARFLKVTLKAPPALTARDADVEALVREVIRRGTVTMTLRLSRGAAEGPVQINEEAVRAYQAVFRRLGLPEQAIPTLPGVISGRDEQGLGEDDWPLVRDAVRGALTSLVHMREREGEALAKVLSENLARLAAARDAVEARAPIAVREQQAKLRERVDLLLAESKTKLDDATLAREVAVLADRSDITEELDRFAAHLVQARELLAKGGDSVGRTLDFLAQEMLREVNTMGSKSNDAGITRHVIELKSDVERFKEQVANVE